MNDLFDRIKRLFAPRPGPPAETIGEATADRPPPPPARVTPVESPREPAVVDELAEVRAALEAVAERPVSAPEPEPEVVLPVREPIPEPLFRPEPSAAAAAQPTDAAPGEAAEEHELEEPALEEPALAEAAERAAPAEAAEAPPPAVGRVGEALVLTLGTPPVTFTVAKTSATLGRGQENTIRLDDLSVSRRHARIAYRQGGYWLSDLGSMGGTWVEGARLNTPRRLVAGEVIDVGLLRLTVGFAGGTANTEAKKSAKQRTEIAGQVRRRR